MGNIIEIKSDHAVVIVNSKRHGIKEILIDIDDIELVDVYQWYVKKPKHNRTFYAVACNPVNSRHKKISLHRVILCPNDTQLVDHINGNGLDNRRKNLRICSTIQNQQNSRIPITNTSGYKGVYLNKKLCKWIAWITKDKKRIYLGLFDCPIKAAVAVDNAAREAYGDFAKLNFPAIYA